MRLYFHLLLFAFIASKANCQSPILAISGIITNEMGEPLPYAHILITPAGTGNVSNSDGNFLIGINSMTDTITVSYIGYQHYSIVASEFLNLKDGKIVLNEYIKQLNEVEVKGLKLSPADLLKEALTKIPLNYSTTSFGLEGFYREKSKVKPNSFISDGTPIKMGNGYNVTEAIFKIYQPPYSGKDSRKSVMLELVKARKVNITKNDDPSVDSLVSNSIKTFPSMLGAYTPFEYDLHKVNGLDFLDSFEDYEYTQSFTGLFNSKPIIRIDFDQKDNVTKCLYKGFALLDANSLAFVEINYQYSKKKIDKAFSMHLLGIGMTALDENVLIKFRPDGTRWTLSYARIGYLFKLTLDRKLKGHKVNADFEINQSSEILITKIESNPGTTIPGNKQFGKHAKLDKHIAKDYDPNFWKDYSVLLIEKND